jgi:hypothetical protein
MEPLIWYILYSLSTSGRAPDLVHVIVCGGPVLVHRILCQPLVEPLYWCMLSPTVSVEKGQVHGILCQSLVEPLY